MKRRILACLLAAAMTASLLAGCGSKSGEMETDTQSQTTADDGTDADETGADTAENTGLQANKFTGTVTEGEDGRDTFESSDGWKVTYDTSDFQMNQNDDSVDIVYTGDAPGTTMITIKYYEDHMPEEVLYAETEDYDQESMIRTEGYFGGGYDWSFTYSLSTAKSDGTESHEFTAVEHNGGSVYIETIANFGSDEEQSMAISDAMAGVLDTFELLNHEEQTEYAYMAGTYVRHYQEEMEGEMLDRTETVVLNADHKGTWTAQDTIDIYWTTKEVVMQLGSTEERYELVIEGDFMYLTKDGETLEFEREAE